MNRTSAAAWRAASTFHDVARANARWLAGGITRARARPGNLAPVLEPLNRLGFVTGDAEPGGAGDTWEDRACVTGFAGPGMALALSMLARTAGLTVVAYDPDRRVTRDDPAKAVAASRSATVITGITAVRLCRGTIAGEWEELGDAAVSALCGAWQVTLIDPQWGRRMHLFNVLATWAASMTPVPLPA